MAEEKKDSKTKRPTAKKRDIQNAKRRLQNRTFKSRMKTAVRSFENEVTQKNETEAKARLNTVFSLLDKGVKKGIYKLNKVSRLKNSFSSRV
nr:30S ribosomal protein S20 [Chlamydiota bacterium]